ncbi:Ca2+/Na+ antiporter [Rivularia sp. PCC 7116]|uniref:sodium:calcium antiporter n=1 Tax=Rivularia sp. PCC 7116 TaxID=373994 RepID=UPI00029F08B5|nr:sodium:calcium antiporter [Rivularia sp. PCC 7116]AFY58976.1 Ca2+/Na+ antiporter [Rivularia sp. PCC 7116]
MIQSLPTGIALFIIAAIVIGLVGTKMCQVADRLADATGWGEAVVGAVFLGGSTSLAGIVTSVTAAFGGHAELAVSNAVGGIAAQTAFLAVADMFYRKANLEHAAASIANLIQGTLLMSLLTIPLLATSSSQISFAGIHPATIAIIGAYIFGLRLVSQAEKKPMWKPRFTEKTQLDEPSEKNANFNLTKLWLEFLAYAVILALAGYLIAQTGVFIAVQTGLSESLIGGLFTAISTSLPELVVTVAAVRQGALTLAVGGIIGGNCFDLLLLAFSDIAFRSGSIYAVISNNQIFVISLTILMTGILLLGLLQREKYGFANIGFESVLILILYLGGIGILISPI